MSTKQLVTELLALPLHERVDVAQALWESINNVPAAHTDPEAIEIAKRRRQELLDGSVTGVSHAEVMTAARNAIRR